MKRIQETWLSYWLTKPQRKPLILRGARQVGKSTLVREFAKKQKLDLFEINLEKNPELNTVFKTLKTPRILQELESTLRKKIVPENGLLFLDEIQCAPDAIPALRYFHEEHPDLPIIAAGSLLEFALSEHEFSMPVGRVEYAHMGPMTFEEFLQAIGEDFLLEAIHRFDWSAPIPHAAHQELKLRLREYLVIGGMPEAVASYAAEKNIFEVQQIHESIVGTYQDDFSKYSKKVDPLILRRLFRAIPTRVGTKIKYTKILEGEKSANVKKGLEWLIKAKIVTPAFHSDANRSPLHAEINESVYKCFFLDVGLMNSVCGVNLTRINEMSDLLLVNEGAIAEQFIAQQLLTLEDPYRSPQIYYWLREAKKENAEVDFVWQHKMNLIPIEVKAGKSGSLKSLLYFMARRKLGQAIRFDLNEFSCTLVSHQVQIESKIETPSFELLSAPLFLVGRLNQLP